MLYLMLSAALKTFSLYTAKFILSLIEFFEIIRFDATIIWLYKAILSLKYLLNLLLEKFLKNV